FLTDVEQDKIVATLATRFHLLDAHFRDVPACFLEEILLRLWHAVLLSAAPWCCARLLRRATYHRQFGGGLQRANEPYAAPAKLAGPVVVRSPPASLAGCVVP